MGATEEDIRHRPVASKCICALPIGAHAWTLRIQKVNKETICQPPCTAHGVTSLFTCEADCTFIRS